MLEHFTILYIEYIYLYMASFIVRVSFGSFFSRCIFRRNWPLKNWSLSTNVISIESNYNLSSCVSVWLLRVISSGSREQIKLSSIRQNQRLTKSIVFRKIVTSEGSAEMALERCIIVWIWAVNLNINLTEVVCKQIVDKVQTTMQRNEMFTSMQLVCRLIQLGQCGILKCQLNRWVKRQIDQQIVQNGQIDQIPVGCVQCFVSRCRLDSVGRCCGRSDWMWSWIGQYHRSWGGLDSNQLKFGHLDWIDGTTGLKVSKWQDR